MAVNAHLIQEMQERLHYVMTTKENAVQETLADTENCLAITGEMKAAMALIQQNVTGVDGQFAGIDMFAKMSEMLEQLQSSLTHILMTQGYQDLTGQVLKRVHADLSTLQIDEQAEGYRPTGSEGFGPAATHQEKSGRANSQSDVDDLLNDLGI